MSGPPGARSQSSCHWEKTAIIYKWSSHCGLRRFLKGRACREALSPVSGCWWMTVSLPSDMGGTVMKFRSSVGPGCYGNAYPSTVQAFRASYTSACGKRDSEFEPARGVPTPPVKWHVQWHIVTCLHITSDSSINTTCKLFFKKKSWMPLRGKEKKKKQH